MIKIDPEFEALIPPLTAEEFAGLEESIIRDGCRDPLVLWGDTLVDGHNRWRICAQHGGIPFKTVQMEFDSRDDVKLWMMKNQLSRRNLNDFQRIEIVHRCEDAVKAKAERRMMIGKPSDPVEIFPQGSGKARDELGAMAGVSGKTYEHAVKVIEKAPEEVKDQLRRGEMSINQAYKTVKSEEKKVEIEEAERAISSQISELPNQPKLTIGDGIGYHPEDKYDLLLTDPPYSTDVENVTVFASTWLPTALQNVKPTGSAYVFIGAYPKELKAYLQIVPPEHIDLVQVLVWTYKNTLGQNPKDRYKQNWQACLYYRGKDAPPLDCPLTTEQWAVQEINAPDGRQGDRYHAWQKPMEIAERFIRHSTEPGMTVFDPFACTGTFLLAAAKLGRNGYGFEIDEENAKIAEERGCKLVKL